MMSNPVAANNNKAQNKRKDFWRLGFPLRIIFELCLFAIASFLLYKTDNSKLAIWFGAIALVNEIIAGVFKQ